MRGGLHVETAGHGPPLVLLHGGLSDHREWRAQIEGLAEGMTPRAKLTVIAKDASGEKRFAVQSRIDTPEELRYYANGGILHYVLRQLAK